MGDRPVAARVGLIGPPGSGKTSLFCALSGVEYARAAAAGGKSIGAHVRVLDPRLARFHQVEGPQRKLVTPALEILDAPSLVLEGPDREGNGGRLATVRECDGYLAVLRAFDGGDPRAQMEALRRELVRADVEMMRRRLEKLQAETRKALPDRQERLREMEILGPLCEAVEAGDGRAFERLTPEEEKSLRGFQFYSRKPLAVLANIAETDLGRPPDLPSAAVRLEMELLGMDPAEREGFMREYGLDRLVLESLPLRLHETLGFITFLTTNEREVAGWALRRGATALEAAGCIHTDLQKGFISCEVVSFEEWSKWKNLHEARTRGSRRVEGRAYVVQDFDILQVKFNV